MDRVFAAGRSAGTGYCTTPPSRPHLTLSALTSTPPFTATSRPPPTTTGLALTVRPFLPSRYVRRSSSALDCGFPQPSQQLLSQSTTTSALSHFHHGLSTNASRSATGPFYAQLVGRLVLVKAYSYTAISHTVAPSSIHILVLACPPNRCGI